MVLKGSKKMLIFGGVVVFFVVLLIFYFNSRKTSSVDEVEKKVNMKEKTTVLKNVEVSVDRAKKRSTIVLSISNIPDKTESIEYELTYPTKDKGLQGVIGTIDELEGSTYTKEIFLGTCSSGACVEHKVDGPISVILRFKGSYGEEVLEREFKI